MSLDTWSCIACELDNGADRKRCERCNTARSLGEGQIITPEVKSTGELSSADLELLANIQITCTHCNSRLSVGEVDYDCDLKKLSAELKQAWRPLTRDVASSEFFLRSSRRLHIVNYAKASACTFLRNTMKMSLTDANAILGRGRMHVLSVNHVNQLLPEMNGGVLLDVGAGEGEVTLNLATRFNSVVATEVSPGMVSRLREKQFACVLETCEVSGVLDSAQQHGVEVHPDGFDGIALMNVLDRCDTPRTLLTQLRNMLRPVTGRLVIAVVLPFRPFVEKSDGRHAAPSQSFGLPRNAGWERSVNQLWEEVLKPLDFHLERLSRVPYISEGDHHSAAYILDDAVFVLSRKALIKPKSKSNSRSSLTQTISNLVRR